MSPQRGFTLMEVLVAMMILAISLTVIMQLFAGGLRSERLSEDYVGAIVLAREKAESIMLADTLPLGATEGEFAPYRWRIDISLHETADSVEEQEETNKRKNPPSPDEPRLFEIIVDVSWPAGRSSKHYRLTSLHLAKIEIPEE
ncbi:MAG: type IV pilus modification PilV family protein [Thermodesulfobacteriota bacterium]